jgi:putative transferase (TIGR04331 family)
VVPEYGWNEGQRDADYSYVHCQYERLLIEMHDALNQYHGTNHSVRYWRILLGPWLYFFTAIVFNRWSSIHLALRNYEISGSLVIEPSLDQVIPYSFDDFTSKYLSHAWNHVICGRILTDWTDVPCEHIVIPNSSSDISGKTAIPPLPLGRKARRMGAQILNNLSRFVPGRSTDAFLINTTLPLRHHFWLQLALGQIPKLWRTPVAPMVMPNPIIRSQFCLRQTGHHGFEQCIRKLISEQIPTLYLEGYMVLQQAAKDQPWPKQPKVIFTANNFQADEVFKAWTAEQTELGATYVIGQHGGAYGMTKYSGQSERNELATADHFLTWGWTSDNPKCIRGLALKIMGMPSEVSDPDGGLLQVTWGEAGYSRDPWTNDSWEAAYQDDQFRFASTLPQYIRNLLTVRLQAAAAAAGGSPRDLLWQARYPEVQVDSGISAMENLICRSRLIVQTYNSTGHLETLGRNIPTIMFWNPNHWELRESAIPYFDKLRTVGVLFDTPESAAAKVAEVWSDVAGWWGQSEVQEARRFFCDRFARTVDNPIRVLKDVLSSVIASAGSKIKCNTLIRCCDEETI